MKVRIGLHTGEAIRSGRDLLGTSVDAAARIMARAEGEQILISDTLKAVLGAAKDLELQGHKRVRLKRPVRTLAPVGGDVALGSRAVTGR